jgi:PAS domain S-box-containing protein
MTAPRQRAGSGRQLVAIFAVSALALLVAGYAYYRVEAKRRHEEQHAVISAVGELKSRQIVRWRTERMADADRVANGPNLARELAALLRDPGDQAGSAALRGHLQREQMGDVYAAALLLAPDGRLLVTTDDLPHPVSPATERAVAAALASQEGVLSDFFRAPEGRVFLDALAAVRDAEGRPLGVVILRSNAESYLYPLIQSWPTPSSSAETLLVQREGEQVVFLNDLRHRPQAALSLRLPMTRTDTPAVQAALGRQGVFEGRDYRGVKVDADLRVISGSPWFLVTKADEAEILAGARSRAGFLSLIAGALILLAAALTASVYQRKQAELFRDLVASERQQREAGEELRTTLTLFRSLMEQSNDGVHVVDPDTARFLDANEKAYSGLGYTREEFLSLGVPDMDCTVDTSAFPKVMAELRKSGSMLLEGVHRRKDGTTFPVEVSLRYVQLDRDYVVAVVRDISERKRAEDVLLRSERRYRTLVDNLPQRVFLKNTESVFVSANEPWARAHNLKAEEAAGKTDFDLFPKALAEKHRAEDARVIASGQRVEIDEERFSAAGHRNVVRTVKTPIGDEHGNVTGVLGISWDNTEREQMEARHLQAQKMEAVGQLAGGIAHDFNNLLTVILGHTGFVLGELPRDSPFRKDLGEAHRAGERAALLTRQLLAFSRKQTLQPAILDLNDVVTGIEPMLRSLIGQEIRVVFDLATDLGAVKADVGQIEQVIMNLSANARDAMPQGGTLTVETANVQWDGAFQRNHPDVAPGDYVRLALTDTGTGIDAETLTRIFEPFFTTKGVGKGTGLGLSTVYGIIRQSDGYVFARSEPGHGSTFEVILPRTLGSRTPRLVAEPGDRLARGSETILLVEDEAGVRRLIHRQLTKCGYTVLEAHDGEEAVLLAARFSGPIDLMVTDVMMPKMDGPTAARQVRERRPAVKVLYVSGYAASQTLIDDDAPFLEKPFKLDVLARLIRTVLDAPDSGHVEGRLARDT